MPSILIVSCVAACARGRLFDYFLIIIITDELSDISATGRAPFGRIADSEVSPQENDSQDIPKPHERVRGPSIIRDIMSDKPRPPPTGVTNGKFKLCQW